MELILVILFLLFFILSFILVNQNLNLQKKHTQNVSKLQNIIFSLNEKQHVLNEKLIINTSFENNYRNDFKQIGSEIVTLQEVFLNIIAKK